jgi:hypothetical protein
VLFIFFFPAQLLSCSGISNLTQVGWLLQLLGWPFITCFFKDWRVVERVFVWLWLNFCCQRRIKPFSPALFLLRSALSRLSWLLPLWDPWSAFHCVLNEWGSNIITHLFALALGLSPALEELLLFAWGLAFSLFETILSTPSLCFCFCQTMFSFYSN